MTPSVGGWRVATSAADTAACVASICPLPRKMASAVASITTSASWAGPTPIASTSRSPTAIPTATPIATSTARRPRSVTVRPSVMIAETGAKNGALCPNTSVATIQAAAGGDADLEYRPPRQAQALEPRPHGDARALRGLLDQWGGAVAEGPGFAVTQTRHRRRPLIVPEPPISNPQVEVEICRVGL